MSVLGNYMSGGGAFLKWESPGTTYSGTITNVELRQARKFESTDLAFWDDGSPQMQCLLTLDTDYRDPGYDDDDGTRMLSINLWSGQKKSLIAACKAAGVAEPEVGMTLTVTHREGIGNAKSPRVFDYVLGKGSPGVAEVIEVAAAPAAAPAAPVAGNPVQTAKDLLSAGLSAADAAKASGLPEATVVAIQNAMHAA